MMKRFNFLIVVLCLSLGCDRYPDPAIKLLENYSFYFQTTPGGRYLPGETVSDSIRFLAVNNNEPYKDSVRVLFEIAKGGGQLTVSTAYTNENGYAYTGWKLGLETFEQVLRAKAYDLSGKYLNSADLTEYCFVDNIWNKCNFQPDCNITDMIADTVNKVTLVVTNNTVYRQGQRYFMWEPVTDPVLVQPRTIDLDRNGVYYVSTWTGEIVKSTDKGVSWKACTKPFPDRTNYCYIYVSNDAYVWAYAFDHPLRYSKDGCATWTDIAAGSGLTAEGFGDIFRLKDGSLLYQGGNCCNLNRSFDDGFTWTKIETPNYTHKLYVNNKDEIFLVSQQSGAYIYKSTDYGATFSYVYAVSPEWWTDLHNTFSKWGGYYYILIPGWGILKSADLTHFEEYWYNSSLRDLFIDHNGVLIAKDWNMNTVYYRNNTEK
jgi:hypothetical protein